ncbi:MAG: WXG100 family type VII secretion target [Blautia sp.]|nr:WXG100 family type VII secretion target [Blautia sp.]
MNGILKVTPERLLAAASELEGQGNQMKNCTDRMVALVNEISGDLWSGDAAAAFKAKFNGLQADIASLHRMVEEHVRDLQEMGAAYSAAENENQEMAASLASEVL